MDKHDYANSSCCLHWTRHFNSHRDRDLFHLSRHNIQLLHETRNSERCTSNKVEILLDVTISLTDPWTNTKLLILKEYIASQTSFELNTYSFSKTWIEKELDSTANRYTKNWLNLPICACVGEFKSLPKHSCEAWESSLTRPYFALITL